jgi:formylmethanofuran dehydrogenase subunit E
LAGDSERLQEKEMTDSTNNPVHDTTLINRIGRYTCEEYFARVKAFHGSIAPGVIIGGIMVDMAMARIPEKILFNAICETSSCLPDSVQLITPCTIGNGWLTVFNLGRFAVSLYDKYGGTGIRVYLDSNKLENWDEIQAWFLKLKAKNEQDTNRLIEQILIAGRSIYSLDSIQVKSQYLTRKPKKSIGICVACGEAYPIKDCDICKGCQGETPYETRNLSLCISTHSHMSVEDGSLPK